MRRADVLETSLAGVKLRNPVLLAAGTAGALDEMGDILDLSRVGGVVGKSITRSPREGNATWRILPHPSATGLGMLNAIGLANPGVEAFVREYMPRARAMPCAVIGSVAGFSVEDYAAVAALMAQANSEPVMGGPGRAREDRPSTHAPLAAIELNLSCPNVKHGTEFGASPAAAAEVVRAVRAAVTGSGGAAGAVGRIPLLVKLSPVAPDLVAIARAAVEAGADGLTLGNTIPAMAIDVESRRPLLANTTGGLSGPAVHAPAVRAVWEVFNRFGRDLHGPGRHLPIVGLGGVMKWEDAAEFTLAGASAVGLGTALFADPRAPLRIARGLEQWVARQGAGSISELVGAVRVE